MITADLKLLVDVAWANRCGRTPYRLSVVDEYKPTERLVRRGLLTNVGGGFVSLTDAGERFVKQITERLRRYNTETK
jgi:hypothetical protein